MGHQQTLIRIDISKEYLSFSAGHFTLFSATERESLHGHNFQVRCSVSAAVGDNGLAFDYVLLKQVVRTLCDELDERQLLTQLSPFLRLEQEAGRITAHFGTEQIQFLERDVLLLPVRNVTIEELAKLLLERLRHRPELADQDLRAIELGVSSGPGQWAFAYWEPTP